MKTENGPGFWDNLFSHGSPFYFGLTWAKPTTTNIFISQQKQGDFYTHVTPFIDFVRGDKTAIDGNYFNVVFRPTFFFYSRNSDQDRTDYYADGALSAPVDAPDPEPRPALRAADRSQHRRREFLQARDLYHDPRTPPIRSTTSSASAAARRSASPTSTTRPSRAPTNGSPMPTPSIRSHRSWRSGSGRASASSILRARRTRLIRTSSPG